MIQHIMLWNYKDEVPPERRAYIEAELAQLPARVSVVQSLQYGPVVGGRNQSFTHCFVMRFNNLQDLAEYTTNPDHQRFAAMLKDACAVQVVVDFDEVNKPNELG